MPDTPVVTGIGMMMKVIGKAQKQVEGSIADNLIAWAEMTKGLADEMCPHETGALLRSGRIEVQGRGLGTRVDVMYGNEEAYYALYVHENTTVYHAPPTCAKWLELAVKKVRGQGKRLTGRETLAGKRKYMDGGEVE